MEMIVAYLVGVVVLQGLFAIRAPHEEALTVFVLCLVWPVSIVLITFMFLLQAVGWEMDTSENTKMFGYRKPTNPNVRGFAVTMFGTEIQFYSFRKKIDEKSKV
jgi:hypothetical protein